MRSDPSEEARTFTESARRSQIIGCTIEALSEVGYSGATLADIARRAGVSKGVVLYYFAGKDDLLEQVVIDVYSRAGEAIADRVSSVSQAAAKVAGYLEANLQFVASHTADVRAVVEIVANARRPDGAHKFAPKGEDPVLTHFKRLLVAGQQSGEFGDFDAHSLAVITRGAIDTASGRLIANPSFDIEAYTQELVTIVGLAVHR
jgi:AcrR family transcriptional regulator